MSTENLPDDEELSQWFSETYNLPITSRSRFCGMRGAIEARSLDGAVRCLETSGWGIRGKNENLKLAVALRRSFHLPITEEILTHIGFRPDTEFIGDWKLTLENSYSVFYRPIARIVSWFDESGRFVDNIHITSRDGILRAIDHLKGLYGQEIEN